MLIFLIALLCVGAFLVLKWGAIAEWIGNLPESTVKQSLTVPVDDTQCHVAFTTLVNDLAARGLSIEEQQTMSLEELRDKLIEPMLPWAKPTPKPSTTNEGGI